MGFELVTIQKGSEPGWANSHCDKRQDVSETKFSLSKIAVTK